MAEKPAINPTPKQQFMQSAAVISRHREMMASADLQQSINMALLEFQRQLADPRYDQAAGAAHFQMVGALGFVRVLRSLAETSTRQDTEPKPRLDHTI